MSSNCLFCPTNSPKLRGASQDAARGRTVSGLGTSELFRCSLQRMWFCWLHQTWTLSTHWGSFQCEVIRMTVSTSLSSWFFAGKWWISPPWLGVSCFHKRRSTSILWSCSQVEGKMEHEFVVKRKLRKAKLSIYQTIYVATLLRLAVFQACLDPEHTREIIYLICLEKAWGNAMGSPMRSWKTLLERGASGLSLVCLLPVTRTRTNGRKWMDVWMTQEGFTEHSLCSFSLLKHQCQ